MDKPGAVEEDVDCAELVGKRCDRLFLGHVELARRDQRVGKRRQFFLGDVRRQHACSFGGKSQCRRAAYPLPCGSYQRALSCQSSCHYGKLPRAERDCTEFSDCCRATVTVAPRGTPSWRKRSTDRTSVL